MTEILIENAVKIVSALLLALIGVLGTYLTNLVAKKFKSQQISDAMWDLTVATQTTVNELQQTLVDDLKEAAIDGKLTTDEIEVIKARLIAGTKAKMLPATLDLLNAAGSDIEQLISGFAESYIAQSKK